ncbi:helix-turn-helix domain-containing protein [Campylobacter concisus]|uniref:helix-turn-helix transcriptional regulator n=1 Tax=Campylobacter concisus TaxID=199 RepID=UPI0018AA706F|nr:helix-turn-helix domain-containing protein [Campylobacter concisus]QPI03663.1 helix-turn-helix domain-containing protein [Campylobacter concisus]
MQEKKLLNSKEAAKLLGVGVSTLYRYMKLSDFPKPIFFTKVTKRYKRDELEAFINKRQNEGRPLPQGGEK